MHHAGYPRVVAVLVHFADDVRVRVLVVQLNVVLVPVEPVCDGCEVRVVCRAVLPVEFAGVPAAGGRPAVLEGVC